MKRENTPEFKPETTRMETFSDAVIAIVMTLLVLELKIPHIAKGAINAAFLSELYNQLPNFAGFALSFLVIAIFWVNHHQLFHALRATDGKLLWYNNHLLFWLCFIPFPTAFIGEYYDNLITVMLYGFVLFMASVSFNMMGRYAYRTGLFKSNISDIVLKHSLKRGLFGPLVYSAATLSAFISVYISIALFILVPIFYFIPQKIVRMEN